MILIHMYIVGIYKLYCNYDDDYRFVNHYYDFDHVNYEHDYDGKYFEEVNYIHD